MDLFKSGNPALKEKMFQNSAVIDGTEVMTEKGTLNKFGLMLLLLLATAGLTWKAAGEGVNVLPWMIGSAIIGLIIALVLVFQKKWGAILAPLYALAEGVFLGGISAYYNYAFAKTAPGIVMQSVGLTF